MFPPAGAVHALYFTNKFFLKHSSSLSTHVRTRVPFITFVSIYCQLLILLSFPLSLSSPDLQYLLNRFLKPIHSLSGMCLQYQCCRCHVTKFDRCDHARQPGNRRIDPRACQNAAQETSQRRQCGQCRSLDEATFRLYSWVGSRGAPRLVTAGGPAEDASSPSGGDESDTHQEQQDEEKESANVNRLDLDRLRDRPLSGSTVGTTTTAPTVLSNTNQAAPSNTDGSAESSDAPFNIGALKRTISTLTFDDLTMETRTAFPASEATNLPPAYARPRSEVGLPPLAPGENDEAGMTDTEEEGEENIERRRSGSDPRGSVGERPLSAQEYLSEARSKFLESRSSF